MKSSTLVLVAFLLSSPLIAMTKVPLPDPTVLATSITGDPAGNVWYADGSKKIVRRSPDGAFSTIELPCETSRIAADADSHVFAVCVGIRRIERIAVDETVTTFGDFYAIQMVVGLTGDVLMWSGQPAIFRVRGDSISRIPIPDAVGYVNSLAGARDGTIWAGGEGALGHFSENGAEVFDRRGVWWLAIGADDQPWSPYGPVFGTPRDEPIGGGYPVSDAEAQSFWTMTNYNAVLRVNADGSIDEFQLPYAAVAQRSNLDDMRWSSMAIAGDSLWIAKRGYLVAIKRDETPPPLRWNHGDLLSYDQIFPCYFEGCTFAMRLYALPEGKIVRQLDPNFVYPVGMGRNREWYEAQEDGSIARKSGSGETLAKFDVRYAGIVLPTYSGEIFVVRTSDDAASIQIKELTRDGSQIREVFVPSSEPSYVIADLSEDQCTIFLTNSSTTLVRKNVCTDSAPVTVSSSVETITAIRALANDELLVATQSTVTRVSRDGGVVQQYNVLTDADSYSRVLALDVDGHSFWTGTQRLQKIDIETGAVLETIDLPALFTLRIFIIDEPRPALFPNGVRRRGVRH